MTHWTWTWGGIADDQMEHWVSAVAWLAPMEAILIV